MGLHGVVVRQMFYGMSLDNIEEQVEMSLDNGDDRCRKTTVGECCWTITKSSVLDRLWGGPREDECLAQDEWWC